MGSVVVWGLQVLKRAYVSAFSGAEGSHAGRRAKLSLYYGIRHKYCYRGPKLASWRGFAYTRFIRVLSLLFIP